MFILKLTNGEFKIDESEIPDVLDSLQKGTVKVFKQGIMNPSFFVGVIKDPSVEYEREVEGATGHYTGRKVILPLPDLFDSLRSKIVARIGGGGSAGHPVQNPKP